MGLMRIAEKCGIIADLSRKLKPVLRFLFPKIPPDHIANEYIATNMIANVFGLGWAATPAGLKAMESLEKLEESRREQQQMKVLRIQNENTRTRAQRTQNKKINPMPRGTANDEMCTFLIINISSLQLIPVNIIAYRSQYGSVNPAEIIGPAILATAISTLTGVIFCKFAQIFVK
jgi:spore maturation protein A